MFHTIDSNRLSMIICSINIELQLLNTKTTELHNCPNNQKLIQEIDTINQKLQANLQSLKLMMEYDNEEIELLEIDDDTDKFQNDDDIEILELYKTAVLEDLTSEIELLEDDLYKTQMLDHLTQSIDAIGNNKEKELHKLKNLENTISLNLKEINSKMIDSSSDEIKQIHESLNQEIFETNLKLKQRIKILKIKRIIWYSLLSLFVLALAFILAVMEIRLIQNKSTQKQINHLEQYVAVEETKEEMIEIKDNLYEQYYTQAYDQTTENNDLENIDDNYHNYVSVNVLSINFDEIKKINPETVGWIRLENTNVNYPFVQGIDNFYYLKHSFDKSINHMGWIYMDYRNHTDFQNKNTIIYGHGLLNNTMFGSLRNAFEEDWQKNPDNQIIKIYTEKGFLLYKLFSVYTIEPEDYYITTNFVSDSEYREFLMNIKKRSFYDFNVPVYQNDRILTLSTCYDNSKRAVLHAKLIYQSY